MKIEFELDSQLLAYDVLLRNELKPDQIAEALVLKPAEQWILDLERDMASLAAAWQQVCGISKYNKRYLLSNLKRHISISGSLQKTLVRYMGMDMEESQRQLYEVLQEGLAAVGRCLLEEQGGLVMGEEVPNAVRRLVEQEVYRFPLTLNGEQLALMAQLCINTGILKPEEKEIKKCMSVIVDHVLTLGGKPLSVDSANRQRKAAGAKACEQVEALLEEALRILREVYMMKVA